MRWPFRFLGIILGILFVCYGIWQMERIHNLIFNYEQVQGQVIRVSVTSEYSEGGVGTEGIPLPGTIIYRPVILYQYHVSGLRLVNDRYDPVRGSRSKAWAESIAAKFAPGQSVAVYYDSRNPAKSVLTKNIPWLVWCIVVGSLIGGAAIILGCLKAASLTKTEEGTNLPVPLGERSRE